MVLCLEIGEILREHWKKKWFFEHFCGQTAFVMLKAVKASVFA